MRNRKANRVWIAHIFGSSLNKHRGLMRLGQWTCSLSLGRSGFRFNKREGDGATPVCDLRPIKLYIRPDKRRSYTPRKRPWQFIRKSDGWCDSIQHPSYNRRIKKPFSESHEDLWRPDTLYDVILETDWNKSPRQKGLGSALFIHYQRPDQGATAGCLAFNTRNMRCLLLKLDKIHAFRIHATGRKPIKRIK
jgi:L,D-peptidoglycan transpeptidase YkuD (ErfK/YbiS/YcfS/YnhG family)